MGEEGQEPRTRGEARQRRARLDSRRYSFSHRVVSLWNSYDEWESGGVLGG